MDNLRAVIKNFYCYISPSQIIGDFAAYKELDENTFHKLGSGYIRKYSSDEIQNMYRYLKSEFLWQNHRLRNDLPSQEDTQLNVFDALMTFDYSVLLEENGEPLCQYQNLLRWRDMITVLEEDLFITSYFAYDDCLKGKDRRDFFWKPVIGHNNFALNRLVSRGVAENHFHLKGSAPLFHLSWLSLMNHVDNSKFAQTLEGYDRNKLQANLSYDVSYKSSGLKIMWYQAALVRVFLFSRLMGEEGIEETQVKRMLEEPGFLLEKISMLDKIITRQRDFHGIPYRDGIKYDYALCKPWLAGNVDGGRNEVITGERWLLYSLFQKAYRKEPEWERWNNWFYLYLVLKANIRMELIQANQLIGFSNFSRYQDRKEDFIDGTEYEKIYLRMAVRDTMDNQHISSLEARISPKDRPRELQAAIERYDSCICEGLSREAAEKYREKYFYVVHFTKEPDRDKESLYRHFYKRQQVQRQARAIAALRENGSPAAERIHGIDAAAAEIGCRPEVFSQAFRYLKNHSVSQKLQNGLAADGVRKNRSIMGTYHVGEDFLDVTDGLRAIEEAVCFLNLRCGDRLGHALVLGIDVDEWYEKKSNRILVSKQDYLDNLVWLHAKIRKYALTECEAALTYIERRFDEYFNEIYMQNLSREDYRNVVRKAAEYFDGHRVIHGYHNESPRFGINEYYDAWKLRGDDPELYRDGFFCPKPLQSDEWDYHGINREYPQNYRIRYHPETAILYYMYHYNQGVRKTGSQIVEIKVNPRMIGAAKKVQERMQKEIAGIGVGIETNPSSNYLIGTFRRYDRHPVIKWYNMGLTCDPELLKACPQIQVSVNTDDQGVFSTYIENEYAYLALALEKSKDSEGNLLYNRSFILQWLENLRRMGIDQTFS